MNTNMFFFILIIFWKKKSFNINCLFVCLPSCLYVCLFICLFVCLFHWKNTRSIQVKLFNLIKRNNDLCYQMNSVCLFVCFLFACMFAWGKEYWSSVSFVCYTRWRLRSPKLWFRDSWTLSTHRGLWKWPLFWSIEHVRYLLPWYLFSVYDVWVLNTIYSCI
jgi:uncharacterized membrane protein